MVIAGAKGMGETYSDGYPDSPDQYLQSVFGAHLAGGCEMLLGFITPLAAIGYPDPPDRCLRDGYSVSPDRCL